MHINFSIRLWRTLSNIFIQKSEVEKLTQSESPIEKAINNYSIKSYPKQTNPKRFVVKIQNTIKAFDENIMIPNDPLKFKTQLKNISDILSTLIVHALEYALNIDPKILRDQYQVVENMIKELDEPVLTNKGTKNNKKYARKL